MNWLVVARQSESLWGSSGTTYHELLCVERTTATPVGRFFDERVAKRCAELLNREGLTNVALPEGLT